MTSLKCFRRDGQAQFRRGVIGDGWCEVDGARRWRQRAHNNRRGSMMVLWQQPEARAQQKLASSARAVDSTQLHLRLRRRRSRTTTTTTRWSSSGLSDCRFGMTFAWQCVLHRNGARPALRRGAGQRLQHRVIRRVAAKGWSSNYSGPTAVIGATVLHATNLYAYTAHGRVAACHSRYRLVQDMVLNVGGRTLRTDVGAGFSIYLFSVDSAAWPGRNQH